MSRRTISIFLLLLLAMAALSQTPLSEHARGVIRLRVRVAEGNKAKGLSRKRFYLIKGSLEENKSVIEAMERQPIVARDCYYRSKGASEGLIAWLKENDCESVYCREVEPKNVEGAEAVPEFQRAATTGEKEFGNRELARKWISVNLPNELRSGFYKLQQQRLQTILSQAESTSPGKVQSVMTDRLGTAFFTDVEPGSYVISNILPTEVGTKGSLWNCPITITADDLDIEKPFLIINASNKDPKDARNKCVSVEKPLPVCETSKQ